MKNAETALQQVTLALNEVTESNEQFKQARIKRRKTGSNDYTDSNAMEELYTAAITELSKSLEENKSCTESSYKKHIVLTFNDIYITIEDLENLQSISQRSLHNLLMYTNDWETFYSINFLMAHNEHLLRLFYFKGAFQGATDKTLLLHNFAKLNMQDVIKDILEKSDDKLAPIIMAHHNTITTIIHSALHPVPEALFPGLILPLDISDITTTILQAVDKTTRIQLLKSVDGNGDTPLHLAVRYNKLDRILCVQDINIKELLEIKNNKGQIPADFMFADHKETQTMQIANAIALEEANNFQLFNLATKSHFIPTHVNLVFQNLAKLHKESLSIYKPNYSGTILQQAPQAKNNNTTYSNTMIIGASCVIATMLLALCASYTSQEEGRGL